MRTYADWLKEDEQEDLFLTQKTTLFLKMNVLSYERLKIATLENKALRIKENDDPLAGHEVSNEMASVAFEVQEQEFETESLIGEISEIPAQPTFENGGTEPIVLETINDWEYGTSEGILNDLDFNFDGPTASARKFLEQFQINTSENLPPTTVRQVTMEGRIPVFKTKTKSEAIRGALQLGFKYDLGQVIKWEPPGMMESERNSPWNYIELYTDKRPLDIAYDQARNYEIPYKGSAEDFFRQYGLRFENYLNSVKPEECSAEPVVLPDPSIVKPTFSPYSAIGFSLSSKMDGEIVGAKIRLEPIANDTYNTMPNKIRHLAAGEPFFITARSEMHRWFKIRTNDGIEGYVVMDYVKETTYDKFGFQLCEVKEGETAMQLAAKFFGRATNTESNGDLRNYVEAIWAFNNPKNNPNNGVYKDAAGEVQVKKGLNIWIPSSRAAYSYIQELPAAMRHGGRPWLERIGVFAFENNPIMWTARYFANLLQEAMSDQDKERIGAIIQEVLRWFQGLLSTVQKITEWVDLVMMGVSAALGNLSITAIICLKRLLLAMVIGCIKQIRSAPPALIGQLMLNYLLNMTDYEYMKGILIGIKDGVGQWFSDVWDIIYAIGKFSFCITPIGQHLLFMDGTMSKWADDIIRIWPAVSAGIQQFGAVVSKMSFIQILESIVDNVDAAGEKLGAMAGDALMNLAAASPYQFGHTGGFVVGYFLPDLVLTVATDSAWLAAKLAKPIAHVLDLVGQIGQKVAKAIEGIAHGLECIEQILKFAEHLMRTESTSGFGKAIREFFVAIREWLLASAKSIEHSSVLLRIKQLKNFRNATAAEALANEAAVKALLDLPKVNADELYKIFKLAEGTNTPRRVVELVIGSKKVENTMQLLKVLEHAKVRRIEQLETLLKSSKVIDLAEVERLLASEKVFNAAQLERIVGMDKVTTFADVERVLAMDEVGSLSQIENLLATGKVDDLLHLERLLTRTDDATQLERMLAWCDDGVELEKLLDRVPRSSLLLELLEKAEGSKMATLLLDYYYDAQKLVLALEMATARQLLYYRTLIPEASEALKMLAIIGDGTKMEELIRFVGVRDSKVLQSLLKNLDSVEGIMATGNKLVFETRLKGMIGSFVGERDLATEIIGRLPKLDSINDLFRFVEGSGNQNLMAVIGSIQKNPRMLNALTRGVEGRNAEALNELAVLIQLDEKLVESVKAKSNVGPVLSGIVDSKYPNRIYTGINSFKQRAIPERLYPLLDSRISEFLGNNIPIRYFGEPGAHSEIFALNEALWTRHNLENLPAGRFLGEEVLSEFLVHNISTNKKAEASAYFLVGKPQRCSNCFGITNPGLVPVNLSNDLFKPFWYSPPK